MQKYCSYFPVDPFGTNLYDYGRDDPSLVFYQMEQKRDPLTAPSGTGKSTQAELWSENQKAEIINGDRAILRKKDGIWKAYGLPYAGSSDIFRNESAPIAAVVILRQAHYNDVQHLRPAEAFRWIYSETIIRSWDEAFQEKVADLITDLVLHVPVLMLNCLPDEGAVSRLKEEIENGED